MKKILLAADLDGTMIFSHRYLIEKDLREPMIPVERLDGREQSFMSAFTVSCLKELSEKIIFLPVTTRSLAQYQRLEWPPGLTPDLALAANGALLVRGGVADKEWLLTTKKITDPWRGEMRRMLENFPTAKLIDESYLFLPCEDETVASKTLPLLITTLKKERVGRKIYLLPPGLDKGMALDRFLSDNAFSAIVTAGDSEMDLPLLKRGEISFFASDYLREQRTEGLFSDFIVSSLREKYCR